MKTPPLISGDGDVSHLPHSARMDHLPRRLPTRLNEPTRRFADRAFPGARHLCCPWSGSGAPQTTKMGTQIIGKFRCHGSDGIEIPGSGVCAIVAVCRHSISGRRRMPVQLSVRAGFDHDHRRRANTTRGEQAFLRCSNLGLGRLHGLDIGSNMSRYQVLADKQRSSWSKQDGLPSLGLSMRPSTPASSATTW